MLANKSEIEPVKNIIRLPLRMRFLLHFQSHKLTRYLFRYSQLIYSFYSNYLFRYLAYILSVNEKLSFFNFDI